MPLNLKVVDTIVPQYESGPLADAMKNFKKISYEDKENNAGVLIGEFTDGIDGGQIVLTQYIVPASGRTYTFTISYNKDSYDNGGKEMVQKIIDSFKVNAK
ncbi:hypothetical protein [Paenibacillus sp.]|jgi:hypothetical protein|uniref:hypothetical protein n=1 Tax=Paenibacillus sp. TaxID=58172 RepID=UPI00281D969F|nr:hypothetical protein [Paenibacillus sp.]MDR0269184.1 hypothetical protein [Paenibacillus sp.]